MSKQRVTLGHAEILQLADWLKTEDKSKRLDGLDAEVIAARAQKDLHFKLNEEHIKKTSRLIGVQWTAPQTRGRHIGNGSTTAAVAADLRNLGKMMVQLMDELGVDKTKSIYQEAVKISIAGGYRETA